MAKQPWSAWHEAVKLKTWSQRRGRSMGYEAPEGKAVPLIDRIHRVMHLWKDGDVEKVNEYLDDPPCDETNCSGAWCSR